MRGRGRNFRPYDDDRGPKGGTKKGAPAEVPLGLVIDKSVRVYINNIPQSCIERDGGNALKANFEEFGPVERYTLFADASGRYTSAAMCTYVNAADAKKAIATMNCATVEGSMLEVATAKQHGVVLMEQLRREEEKKHPEGKWQHDLFDKRQNAPPEGDEFDHRRQHNFRGRYRGGGRGGRYRWGGRGRGSFAPPPSEEALNQQLDQFREELQETLPTAAPDTENTP